jgi:hypothetical protein
MSNYKVTEKDLIKDLKGFPIEVVEKMLERQKEQKGYRNISEFQASNRSGFSWIASPEGHRFWQDIIQLRKFNLFFERYPRKNKYVYIYQDDTKNGKDIINTLIKHGGVDSLALTGESKDSIYYSRLSDNTIVAISPQSPEGSLIKTFYTEIQPEPSVTEYTMQEIADKLGIDVNELRIKK